MTNKFYSLLVYDPESKGLLYTKYNFNFELYASDFKILTSDRNQIFDDFWKRNNYVPTKPYQIYADYIKYFKPITQEIVDYIDKYGVFHSNWEANISTNISDSIIEINQFDLIPYTDEEVRRLQDYLYPTGTEFTYTKYNFNFDTYAADFRLYTKNKLVLFTDFVLRCYSASGVVLTTAGYGIAEEFKQYFTSNAGLMDYLVKYGVYSILKYTDRNISNIDFEQYIKLNGDLGNLSVHDAKEHYLRYGQFEMRQIAFIKEQKKAIEITRSAICSVFLKNKGDSPLATGFLYAHSNENRYIVTCYHIIKKYRDQRYIYGIFENDNKSIIAQFKIIGYDSVSDVMVAKYDHTLNYNIVNKIDLTGFPSIVLNSGYKTVVSENVSLIGNIGFDDNLSYSGGRIMNTRYSGGFNVGDSADTIPESVLIQTYGTPGMSGSPVLKGDPLGKEQMECIGMLVGALKSSDQIMVAIDGYLLDNIVQVIIDNWYLYIDLLGITNQAKIDNFVKNGYPKAWLGITNQYNHPILAKTYKELANLSYVGGLLITNFIIGFNVRDEQFVYSSNDLVDRNVIKFDGPLLNSKIYSRFITNGNVPIVIKSISYFDTVNSSFEHIHIGKFGQQIPYSHYVYGQSYIATYQLPDTYYNTLRYEFGPITIEYYYYDGEIWRYDVEKLGGNSPDWYITYEDNASNKYYQHKFEFPQILIPYVHDYSISKYASEMRSFAEYIPDNIDNSFQELSLQPLNIKSRTKKNW
jgi:hypothetical protein